MFSQLSVFIVLIFTVLSTNAQNPNFMTPYFKNGTKYSIFYASWSIYARQYYVSNIPIDYVQEIIYGFATLKYQSSGSYQVALGDEFADVQRQFSTPGYAPFQGNFGEFYKLKAAGKKFNLVLSIGGWTNSAYFSNAMLTDASRNVFTDSIINLLITYPIFCGVNFDWEYMSNDGKNWALNGNQARVGDADRFVQMLQLLRSKLKQRNMSYILIQFAALATPARYPWPVAQVAANVDEMHLMSYEFATSQFGDRVTTHQTNLWPSKLAGTKWSVHETVLAYKSYGVPLSKMLVGSAWYSRGFANSLSLNTAGSGVVPDFSWDVGIQDYKVLPAKGAIEYWDGTSSAGYSYDVKRRVFLSYDNVPSVAAKSEYVVTNKLRGIFAWAIDEDAPISSPRSITKVLYNRFVKGIVYNSYPKHSWPPAP